MGSLIISPKWINTRVGMLGSWPWIILRLLDLDKHLVDNLGQIWINTIINRSFEDYELLRFLGNIMLSCPIGFIRKIGVRRTGIQKNQIVCKSFPLSLLSYREIMMNSTFRVFFLRAFRTFIIAYIRCLHLPELAVRTTRVSVSAVLHLLPAPEIEPR
jgi:hypothetical protein